VSGDSDETSALWGVFILAVKEIWPGLSAVNRTTITWSTGLANVSRAKATPPLE
jgi:hypothetical protein